MPETIKLVTKREETAERVVNLLRDTLGVAEKENCCGMAIVLVKQDGGVTVTSVGHSNRVLLLGAVTDLQYTLAKDGDK